MNKLRREIFGCLFTVVIWAAMMGGFLNGQVSLPEAVIHYADMVLYNGKVLTADEGFSVAQAIAIRDGKFLAVGNDQEILPLAGPGTEKIDLSGRTVIPGFVDTHLHQAHVGNVGGQSVLRQRLLFETVEGALEEIRAQLQGVEPGEWLVLSGPRNAVYYQLNRTLLDPISPQNPLVIMNMNEESLANTLALKESRIPTDTPGYILDPETGEPTGHLARWASGTMMYEKLPWPALTEELLERQKNLLKNLHSRGITSLGGRSWGLTMTIYNTLQRRGELNMRIRLAPMFLRLNANAEGYLKRLGSMVEFGNDMLKIIGATVEPVDGITRDGAALSLHPKLRRAAGEVFGSYGPNLWEDFGPYPLETPKEQTEWQIVQLAAKYGWNITSMHSTGDGASKVLLDSYRDANETQSIQEMRFGIDHGLMQSPENLDTIKELGILPSVGMIFQFREGAVDRLIYMYGADRVFNMTPVKSLINAGVKVVAEADTLQEPYVNPLWQIEKFITRTDEKGRVWNPAERVSRQEALYMYTVWAAYYHWDEEILGSIEVGKLADLAVLNRDFMTVPENEISKIPISLTVLGGKIVYREGDPIPPFLTR